MLFRGIYLLTLIVLASSLTQCASKEESSSEEQGSEIETNADSSANDEKSNEETAINTNETNDSGEDVAMNENAETEISAGEDTNSSPIETADIPQENAIRETPSMEATASPPNSVPNSPNSTDSVPNSNSGSQVLYVKSDGAVLRASASESAGQNGTLEQGDHILVTIEGSWAKTMTGNYVLLSQLSAKSVGRKLPTNEWK